MARIVTDLLMLAKAEQPDFVVLRPAEVATLMLDIESKSQALDARRWLLMEVPRATSTSTGNTSPRPCSNWPRRRIAHPWRDPMNKLGSTLRPRRRSDAGSGETTLLTARRCSDMVVLDMRVADDGRVHGARRIGEGITTPVVVLTARDSVTDTIAGS